MMSPWIPAGGAIYYPPTVDPAGLRQAVRTQVEFYFSTSNLDKDTFLRGNMDAAGWIPLQIVCSFKRLLTLTSDPSVVIASVADSPVVEVRNFRIRRRSGWERYVPANAPPALAPTVNAPDANVTAAAPGSALSPGSLARATAASPSFSVGAPAFVPGASAFIPGAGVHGGDAAGSGGGLLFDSTDAVPPAVADFQLQGRPRKHAPKAAAEEDVAEASVVILRVDSEVAPAATTGGSEELEFMFDEELDAAVSTKPGARTAPRYEELDREEDEGEAFPDDEIDRVLIIVQTPESTKQRKQDRTGFHTPRAKMNMDWKDHISFETRKFQQVRSGVPPKILFASTHTCTELI